MASPFGPPPASEKTLTLPSGVTREHLLLRISVSTTDPSAHTTGPSGNPRPVARIVTSVIVTSLQLLVAVSVAALTVPSTVGCASGVRSAERGLPRFGPEHLTGRSSPREAGTHRSRLRLAHPEQLCMVHRAAPEPDRLHS